MGDDRQLSSAIGRVSVRLYDAMPPGYVYSTIRKNPVIMDNYVCMLNHDLYAVLDVVYCQSSQDKNIKQPEKERDARLIGETVFTIISDCTRGVVATIQWACLLMRVSACLRWRVSVYACVCTLPPGAAAFPVCFSFSQGCRHAG